MTDVFASLSAALAGRYRLERELGAGGMATVYLAHDLKHDRRVAIKVLRPELAAVIGAERFLAEIRMTAQLQHPSILPLFDSGRAPVQTGGRGEAEFLFYVMPFVEGETLRDRLKRETRLAIDDAVRITAEVGDALEYAHRRGVIHRDIKPENILLQDGRALIADFGIALTVDAADQHRLTETGLSIGTPGYMSPEQALGERTLDARTDVFSLGVVIYEMVTGARPFDGPTAQAIVASILTEAPVPPSRRRAEVPRELGSAILRALDKDRDRRPSSAGVLRDSVAGAARATGGHPHSARRRWVGAAAALATIVVVMSLVIVSRHSRATPSTRSHAAPDTAAARLVNVAEYWLQRRTEGGCDQAIPRYAEATTRDTSFVAAWAGLANANAICALFGTANPFNGLVAARAAAEHALALDSGSAKAWTALGMTALFSEQAWDVARRDLERAAALDSTTPWPWLYRTWTFVARGRLDSAETSVRQAYQRAPTSNLIGARLASVLALREHYAEAERTIAEVLQRDSDDLPARYTIVETALRRHRCADALGGANWLLAHHALEPSANSSSYRMNGAIVAAVWAECGRVADARRYADSVAAREAAGAYVDPWTQVMVFAALRDTTRMFAELESAVTGHNWGLLYLRTEPLLAAYRDMPHFQDLLRRLHEI